jgi:hypothetical protein
MPLDAAREIIESCAHMFAGGIAPPRSYPEAPDTELFARKLATMLVEDVIMYHGDEITAAGSSPAARRAAIAAHIEEARALFRERVAAGFYGLYDEQLARIDVHGLDTFHHEIIHGVWLQDAESARSVAHRWASAISRADPTRRAELHDMATRWLTAWTPDGPVRTAWRDVLR